MAELIDKMKLLRQIAEFGREIPKDQVIGVIARQESVGCDGDLISRETAIKILAAHYAKKLMDFGYKSYEEADTLEKMYCDGVSDAMNIVDTLPTADRPKGKWHYSDGKLATIGQSFGVICDQCGTESEYCTNFCGECGADMRGEDE